jgi:hypothetical protein
VFGTFAVEFAVPLFAQSGAHRVRVFTEDTAEIASTQFVVTDACPGDCNRDGEVTIDEVLRGVALALGTTTLPCPAYGNAAVTIDKLVTAVDPRSTAAISPTTESRFRPRSRQKQRPRASWLVCVSCSPWCSAARSPPPLRRCASATAATTTRSPSTSS